MVKSWCKSISESKVTKRARSRRDWSIVYRNETEASFSNFNFGLTLLEVSISTATSSGRSLSGLNDSIRCMTPSSNI